IRDATILSEATADDLNTARAEHLQRDQPAEHEQRRKREIAHLEVERVIADGQLFVLKPESQQVRSEDGDDDEDGVGGGQAPPEIAVLLVDAAEDRTRTQA